jgi:hypothetical protein
MFSIYSQYTEESSWLIFSSQTSGLKKSRTVREGGRPEGAGDTIATDSKDQHVQRCDGYRAAAIGPLGAHGRHWKDRSL